MRLNVMAITLLFACQPEPDPPPVPGAMDVGTETLVQVEGHPVTRKMLDVSLSHGPEAQRQRIKDDIEEQKNLLETLAYAELLYHKAIDAKLHEDPDVLDAMAVAQREIMANIMIEKLAADRITAAEVQARYDALGSRLNRPNVRIHHILVEREDKAKALVEQLQAGTLDFLDAAKRHSIDSGVAEHGGDLGWTIRPPIREL
ncbi:MAG: peptidylprolyl isomerase, partial [Myxococcota bacterium]